MREKEGDNPHHSDAEMYQRSDADRTFEQSRVAGCLLGGAIGDALGAPVEFRPWSDIEELYGPEGITEPPLVDGMYRVTDDTQMTMFTAEGVIRAVRRARQNRNCDYASVIYHAYLRWLHTQGEELPVAPELVLDGWLLGSRDLYHRRSPGSTCLSALASGEMGSMRNRINDSKGSGGVMRVAPIGLAPAVPDPFNLGAQAAAISHGHPSCYLAAGAFAAIIRFVMEGAHLEQAIARALRILESYEGHDEVTSAIASATWLAERAKPSVQSVESLGQGWVAEEALAIALYCSLAYPDDFLSAVRLAANHSGDSDSTAAMTGNLMGARMGVGAIPGQWLAHLELRDEIQILASDLLACADVADDWHARYPPH